MSTFRKMPIQIHANLLNNHFPPNIVHANHNTFTVVGKTDSLCHHLFFFKSKVKMKLYDKKEVAKPLLQTNPSDCLKKEMVFGYCKLNIK